MVVVAVGAEPSDRQFTMRSTRVIVAACMLGGLVLRFAMLARPVATIDRLFVPDDTYYTLAIARSIAHGAGPRSGAGPLTSGFQPLIAFLMVPVYWLGAGNWTALRVDIAILAVADVVTIGALACIAYRVAGRAAAIWAAILWALSPLAVGMAMGGLETSLAVMFEALLVLAWLRVRDRRERSSSWAVLGVVAGLTVLARVDAVILIAALALIEARALVTRRAALAAASGAAVLAPWWIWCWAHFGSPIPGSGSAVRRHPFIAPWAERILSVAAGSVASAPFTDTGATKSFLVTHRPLGVALFVVLVAAFVAAALFAWRSARRRVAASGHDLAPVAALSMFGAALLVFYAWYGFSSYITRYLAPAALCVTVALAAFLAARVHGSGSGRGPVRIVALAIAVALLGTSIVSDAHAFSRSKAPRATATASLTGGSSNGRSRATREALTFIPTGARVGAWQSGALAYFANRGIQVLNLDGVVNPDSPDMRDPAAMARYIKSRRLDWLVDWAILEAPFVSTGRFTLNPAPGVKTVASVSQDNGLRVSVLRIVWNMNVQLRHYFAGAGALYTRFVAASAPLMETMVTHEQCVAVARRLAATGTKRRFVGAAAAAPDSALAGLFEREVTLRLLTLVTCIATPSTFHAPAPLSRAERAQSQAIATDLASFHARMPSGGTERR